MYQQSELLAIGTYRNDQLSIDLIQVNNGFRDAIVTQSNDYGNDYRRIELSVLLFWLSETEAEDYA